ncbi:MAG: winged helix DNA-binding protein [Rhodothermia bacterium]|nr:winged helix DNA-binding protein [Rhodothermia bacterium]
MGDKRLTERQLQVLGFVRDYMREYQKPPTLKELAGLMGIQSTNAVHKVLETLVEKGYIEKDARASRGIRLIETPMEATPAEVPMLPIISRPLRDRAEWAALRYRTMGVDANLLRNARERDCIVVPVGDDGMAREGIRAGDWVVVETGPLTSFGNGELVLAVVRERSIVRQIFATRWQVQLRPSEKRYTEEVFNTAAADAYVVGRVVCLIRRY